MRETPSRKENLLQRIDISLRASRLSRRTRVLTIGLLALAALVAPGLAKAATPLYPNLVALPPSELQFDQVVFSDGTTHNVLRFSQATENVGQGAFDLRG